MHESSCVLESESFFILFEREEGRERERRRELGRERKKRERKKERKKERKEKKNISLKNTVWGDCCCVH